MQSHHATPVANAACTLKRFDSRQARRRPSSLPAWLLGAALALVLTVGVSRPGYAQSPYSFRIPKLTVEDVERADEPLAAPAAGPRKLIVDTDPGVDDAAALIWLLSQQHYPVTPLGIVTVAGNASLDNTTNNARLILNWMGRSDIPVIPGASQPLAVPLSSTPKLIHGPDGLWFLGWTNPQPPPAVTPPSAVEFYCQTLQGQEAEVLVLTLGPLTNVAQAIASGCAVAWDQVQMVSLGGAKLGGSQTPNTETNIWQDPEAAIQVVNSGVRLTLVTLDGFGQFTVGRSLLKVLENTGVPAMRALLPALQAYVQALSGGGADPALPDPVAAMIALDARLGLGTPGLVKVLGSDVPEYVRGQTAIALDLVEWPTLAATDAELSQIAETVFADPSQPDFGYLFAAIGQIVAENPPNATVVTDILAQQMQNTFRRGVTAPPGRAKTPTPDQGEAGGDADTSAQGNLPEYKLYLPGIQVSPDGQ